MSDSATMARWQRRCDALAAPVLAWCVRRGLKLACAESLTGGLLADAFVRIPGASDSFLGSAVTYDIRAKASILGIDRALLEREGAVHPEVARQMAAATARLYDQPGYHGVVGLSTTGVAGPGPDGDKPAGLVYVGLSLPGAEADALAQTLPALAAEPTAPGAVPIIGGAGAWAGERHDADGRRTIAAELRLGGDRPAVRRLAVLDILAIVSALSGCSQE
ncbi:nicotinamide-nucleotide amidohydrolase family protein [Bifidobacterium pullorum subsp. saeculare]|uniref:Nicotinamide-nucleotide amidohydrolase family protein n=1 Tax=Bifidobacterium pullorum subsp. saeculare TaxID=78257 RepID=A0A938WX29_9BIFI|nr:nicotinamide-nucleotide amidohydrolase family protein [Bifidobacterium pullorum]MBM6699496.1 nicotinamide-nucleotide amidohydrolase family protein [Bifidobacterium pullorum subsp. saeculare]